MMAGVRGSDDHSISQQRTVKDPTMKSAELRSVAARLDVLRDIMVELVAALPPPRSGLRRGAGVGRRLIGRICDMDIDDRSAAAMVRT